MAGPAPTEFLQHTENRDKKFHEEIAKGSTKAGHPATPQSVNPDDQFPLKDIQEAVGDTTHVVGSTFEELVRGSDTSHVRTTKGKVPISILAKKWARRLLWK